MAFRPLPDADVLRKLLRYEPDTGNLYWRERTPDMFTHSRKGPAASCNAWNAKNAGRIAFNHRHGWRYLAGGILGEVHLAHRIAWAIHYGVSDFGLIDHIDGDGANNRIVNLRESDSAINAQNAHQRRDCSSGITGVNRHYDKRTGRRTWVARIQVRDRRYTLGSFDSLEEAVRVRREAEYRFGFGPVHGKVRGDA